MNDSISVLQSDIAAWADGLYPSRTAHTSLVKLVLEEIPEFISSGMKDPDEYADLVILILDIAHLRGIDVGKAVVGKMQRNRERVWVVNPETGVMSHV